MTTETARFATPLQSFRRHMEEALETGSLSSTVLAVLQNGEPVRLEGFGLADREAGTPAGAGTLYNIGSVSKVYTAAALVKLLEAGRLSLDDPVADHLPEFVMADKRYRAITLRMLLNHSAGLPTSAYSYGVFLTREADTGYYDRTLRELAGLELKSAPGDYPAYANDGFTLAQKVVERVSGMDYGDYLHEVFFAPMGLENTGLSGRMDSARFGCCHDREGNRLPRESVVDDLAGAGGLAANAEDLARFADQMLSPQSGVLRGESIAALRAIQNLDSKYGNRSQLNGLGWDFTLPQVKSVQVLSKNGGTTVYSTQLLTAPDAGLTVACLSAGSPFSSPVYGASQILMLDLLDELGCSIYGNEVSAPAPAAAPAELESFSGCYLGMSGPPSRLEVAGDRLTCSVKAQGGWQAAGPMPYREDGSFGLDEAETGGSYVGYRLEELDGKKFLVQRVEGRDGSFEAVAMQRLEEFDPPESWEGALDGLWLTESAFWGDYQLGETAAIHGGTQDGPRGYVTLSDITFRIRDATTAQAAAEVVSGIGNLVRTGEGLVLSGARYRPAGVAVPTSGDERIVVGEAGAAQWYRAREDLTLTLAADAALRAVCFSEQGARLFDSMTGRETYAVPRGSYLLVCGEAGGALELVRSA